MTKRDIYIKVPPDGIHDRDLWPEYHVVVANDEGPFRRSTKVFTTYASASASYNRSNTLAKDGDTSMSIVSLWGVSPAFGSVGEQGELLEEMEW